MADLADGEIDEIECYVKKNQEYLIIPSSTLIVYNVIFG